MEVVDYRDVTVYTYACKDIDIRIYSYIHISQKQDTRKQKIITKANSKDLDKIGLVLAVKLKVDALIY